MQYPDYTWRRVAATLIDYTLVFALTIGYIYLLGTRQDNGEYKVVGLLALLPFLFWFLYFVVAESAMQATFGHQLLGLKVIRMDGSKPGFGLVLVRRIFDAVEISWCLGFVAFILVCATTNHQRIGDLVAQTRVVGRKDVLQEIQFDFEAATTHRHPG
jgi:uncharacterized RDD family membrane protein YckC